MLDRDVIGICPICGSEEFEPGFQGRVHPNGALPQCVSCKSAERHRIIRFLYSKISSYFADWRALQFAPEGAIERSWFKSFEYSIFDGHNSLDMTAIDLPDGHCDLVISNHVLEHVPDDAKAIAECLRIVGPEGLVHVNAPSPQYRYSTVDWGFADPKINEHYRDYGADMGVHLLAKTPDCHACCVVGVDPVTFVADQIYFFSRSAGALKSFGERVQKAGFACVVVA